MYGLLGSRTGSSVISQKVTLRTSTDSVRLKTIAPMPRTSRDLSNSRQHGSCSVILGADPRVREGALLLNSSWTRVEPIPVIEVPHRGNLKRVPYARFQEAADAYGFSAQKRKADPDAGCGTRRE